MAATWTTAAEYDRFADIYAVWTETAASTRANLAFYVDAYLAAEGLVVELGVGDGRIAVQAAAQGRDIIGVDLSAKMLARCRRRAEEAGVLDRLTLIHADFRDFQLEAPASLICAAVPQPRPPADPGREAPGPDPRATRSSGPAGSSSSTTS